MRLDHAVPVLARLGWQACIVFATGWVGGCDGATEPAAYGEASMPVRIQATTPADLEGTVGTSVIPAPGVRVTDADNRPVEGLTIAFVVEGVEGVIAVPTDRTDAQGFATVGTWTLGTKGCGKIVFVSARDGNQEIYSVNADGTGLTRLTNDPSADRAPVWSPDGQRVAFVSDRSGAYEIYVMKADGSDVVRRTFSANYSQGPSWSPDGTLLAYSTLSDGSAPWAPFGLGSMNLWTVGADASGPEPALLFETPGSDEQSAWSPDGTRLALVSDWAAYDFVEDIYLINADGSGFEPLTGDIFDHMDYRNPAWSPDGSLIAVEMSATVGIDEFVTSIGVMNDDGTALHSLISEAVGRGAWSPDGQMIAYTSGVGPVRHILWVRVDGSNSGVIMSNGWSPDWR